VHLMRDAHRLEHASRWAHRLNHALASLLR
jgi:hypothetical protein